MTELGIVGDATPFVVNATGTVSPLASGPSVQWWVAAEDRWHRAPREVAVRQSVADASAVETRLRIPGGDAVFRVTVVPDAGSAAAIVEIENASPVPVAVAAVVSAPVGPVEARRDVLLVDGAPVVRFDHAIARVVEAADVDTVAAEAEATGGVPPLDVLWPRPGPVVAAIVPLPHRDVIRCSVAAGPGALASPVDLPPLEAVARGWRTHLDTGTNVDLDEARLLAVVDGARRHLLSGAMLSMDEAFWSRDVEPWVPAVAAAALDAWGHQVEARELLIRASGVDDLLVHARRPVAAGGALLWAWAERLERRADPDLEAALAPWIEDVTAGLLSRPNWLARRRADPVDGAWRAVGLAAAASTLSRAGNNELGADIIDALPDLVAEIPTMGSALPLALGANRLGLQPVPIRAVLAAGFGVGDGRAFETICASSGPTAALAHGERTQHPALSALVLLAVRRALLTEAGGTGGPLNLLPEPDRSWLGTSVDVTGVPIAGGSASFGVRWHGDRPALLWEVDDTVSDVTVRAPGLDADWSAAGNRGEALLAPTAGLNQAPRSPMPRSGHRVEPGDEPESFA